jgi:hypothetical protein
MFPSLTVVHRPWRGAEGQDIIQGGAAVSYSLSVHAAVCACALLVPGVEEYVRCGRVSSVFVGCVV